MNPDETTFDYLRDYRCVPDDFEAAVADWKALWLVMTDAVYDKVIHVQMYLILLNGDLGDQSFLSGLRNSFPVET